MSYVRVVRRGWQSVLVAGLVTLLAGCGVDLSLLPLPAPGVAAATC